MKLDNIGTEIGVRVLKLSDGQSVTVRIGVPQEDGRDYFCPYQIIGIGKEDVSYAMGVDALQALQLTLKKIGVTLYASNQARSGSLKWEAQTVEGDLGFPVTDSAKELLPAELQ